MRLMKNRDEKNPEVEIGAATELDALGLKCPLPALKTRRALARLRQGATLIVVADDPMAAIDIPHLTRELEHELVSASQEGGHLRFVIRKRAATKSG
jgi:tRNA 2-thiouridine synthesizing protein A